MKADQGHLKFFVPTGDYSNQTSYGIRTIYQGNVFRDAAACASVTFKYAEDTNTSAIGLVFWGASDTAYYAFLVSLVGSYTVIHRLNDTRVLTPVAWTASPLIPKAAGQPVELQVITKGDTATLFVDKQKIAEVKGQLPPDGQQVGLTVIMSTKETTAADQFLVDNFEVRN